MRAIAQACTDVMFGKRLKELRQQRQINTTDIAKELGIHQTSLSYFENREPESIDLYLHFLAQRGIDLNEAFLSGSENIAKYLKNKRQEAKIKWHEISHSIGINQSSLSYLENREDTLFINYLKLLVQRGVNLNDVFA